MARCIIISILMNIPSHRLTSVLTRILSILSLPLSNRFTRKIIAIRMRQLMYHPWLTLTLPLACDRMFTSRCIVLLLNIFVTLLRTSLGIPTSILTESLMVVLTDTLTEIPLSILMNISTSTLMDILMGIPTGIPTDIMIIPVTIPTDTLMTILTGILTDIPTDIPTGTLICRPVQMASL